MSARYFEQFYNGDPMVEITEAEALSSGYYVIEDEGAMRRYRRFSDGRLDSLVYASWNDPSEPLADIKRRNDGVDAEVHSPIEHCSHGGQKWRIWYFDSFGNTKKILEREFASTGDALRVSLLDPQGELIEYTAYHYHDGALYELTTHAPDGTVTSRRDA